MKYLFRKDEGIDRIRFFYRLSDVSTARELRAVENPVETFSPIAARYATDRRNGIAIREDYHAVLRTLAAMEAPPLRLRTLAGSRYVSIERFNAAWESNLRDFVDNRFGDTLRDPKRTDFGWADGDFNWDGEVTLADLGILASNFGSNGPIPQAAFGASLSDLVPEPATGSLFVLCSLALLKRKYNPVAVLRPEAQAKAETGADGREA